MQDNAIPLLSSIFLDRLLHPGVFSDSVLRATMMDYNRCLTDSELESLKVDGLKKEILLLVEYEVALKTVPGPLCFSQLHAYTLLSHSEM